MEPLNSDKQQMTGGSIESEVPWNRAMEPKIALISHTLKENNHYFFLLLFDWYKILGGIEQIQKYPCMWLSSPDSSCESDLGFHREYCLEFLASIVDGLLLLIVIRVPKSGHRTMSHSDLNRTSANGACSSYEIYMHPPLGHFEDNRTNIEPIKI